MPTIDLGVAAPTPTPTPTPASTAAPTAPPTSAGWADLPRRVGLTLPELQLLAANLGAPLPFDVTVPVPESRSGLSARLGRSVGATQDEAYAEALRRLGDPAGSLRRRGLLAPDVDPGIAGALGLLGAPSLAVDLDVAVDGRQAHAWHRYRDGTVATLATSDGLVYELAWFAATAWPAELARVATLPDETRQRASLVPTTLTVPWQVADAATEAVRAGRPELVPVITGDATLGTVLTALSGEAHGRLRALVSTAAVEPRAIGVAAWTLLADGWHALRAQRAPDEHTGTADDGVGTDLLEIVRVDAADLAAELAPLLAEVA